MARAYILVFIDIDLLYTGDILICIRLASNIHTHTVYKGCLEPTQPCIWEMLGPKERKREKEEAASILVLLLYHQSV